MSEVAGKTAARERKLAFRGGGFVVEQRTLASIAAFLVLLGLWQLAQRCPRFATFQQQRVELGVGVEHTHGRLTIPKTESRDLVRAFQMRHTELEYGARPVTAHDRCDPCRTCFAIPRRIE